MRRGFFDDHFGHLDVALGGSSKVELITSAGLQLRSMFG